MVFQSTKGAGNSCIDRRETDLPYLTMSLLNLTWHSWLPWSGVCCFGIPPCHNEVLTSHRTAQQPPQGIKEPDYPEWASCAKSRVCFGKDPEIKAQTC